MVADVNLTTVEETAKLVKEAVADAECIPMKCDVSKNEDCQALVDMALEKFCKLSIAVNNAGMCRV